MIPGLFIYIYILLGCLVLVFDTRKSPEKLYLRVFNVTYIVLALLAAFSYGVGNDTMRYMSYFNAVPKLGDLTIGNFIDSHYNPLYIIINSLCRTIYDDFLLFQLLQVFLLFHSMYLLMKKIDIRKLWVLFLFMGYCYFALLSGRRESFALSFCFYALLFYIDNKWIPFYLLVLFGFMCHSGVVVFLLFPLVKLFRRLSVWYTIPLFVAIYFIGEYFDQIQFLAVYLSEEDSLLLYQMEQGDKMNITTIILLVSEIFIIYALVIEEGKAKIEGYERDFVYFALFQIFLSFLSSSLPILYRYRAHFCIFLYYTLSICFKNTKKNAILIALVFMVFSYSQIASFVHSMKNFPVTYNYCSVFSDDASKAKMAAMSNANVW